MCTDPPVRLPPSCHSKMHSYSHSACDCYCKTRVPIARQREEIQSGRSCVRCSISKTKTTRSGNKIPLLSSRVIDDEPVRHYFSIIYFQFNFIHLYSSRVIYNNFCILILFLIFFSLTPKDPRQRSQFLQFLVQKHWQL